ncbi:MAG TPA: endonuclease IV [Desulfotomaculum sp.]|nr:endonuclease IV [Desulfotomaculum sp.]
MKIKFGPAGNSPSFYASGFKKMMDVPGWLRNLKLQAYEYQGGRGVRISEENARRLGELARENGITLSIHAPYYITLGTADARLRENTRRYILDAMRAAHWMGARLTVFHPGTGAGKDRAETLQRAGTFLKALREEADEMGLADVLLAPETAGKRAKLGNLEEILALCTFAPRIVPALDFGHLHAVTGGGMVKQSDFAGVLDLAALRLGKQIFDNLHIHFSPVEFTPAGEKKHGTTLNKELGPDFQPLAEILAARNIKAVVICESGGRQAEDALVYQEIYREALRSQK